MTKFITLIFSCILFIYIISEYNVFPSQKKDARNHIKEVFHLVQIGSSVIDVEKLLLKITCKNKNLKLDVNRNGFVLRTPIEFPSFTTSWYLFIWSDKGVITKKAIRTLENANKRPNNAPLDE